MTDYLFKLTSYENKMLIFRKSFFKRNESVTLYLNIEKKVPYAVLHSDIKCKAFLSLGQANQRRQFES